MKHNTPSSKMHVTTTSQVWPETAQVFSKHMVKHQSGYYQSYSRPYYEFRKAVISEICKLTGETYTEASCQFALMRKQVLQQRPSYLPWLSEETVGA